MSPQQLFARQAFAMALGSLSIEVEPKAVDLLSRNSDEFRCSVRDPESDLWHIADGSFSGDEDGGEIKIVSIHNRRLTQARSFWFMASVNGRPIPVENVTGQVQPLILVEEQELAEAA